MLGPDSSTTESSDFFSNIGTEVQRKGKEKELERAREIEKTTALENAMKTQQETDDITEPPPNRTFTPGGPGSQWRMTRLKRVYETADEEGRDVLEIALERFGSMEAWEEALEERRVLDQREGRRGRQPERSAGNGGEKGFMFSNASSRSSSFRRPGGSAPSTPSPPTPGPPVNRRLDSLRLPSQASSPLQQSHTPIPSVMTPPPKSSSTQRSLSPSSLNKLQAKVLRAKLMDAPNAEQLEREYEDARSLANGTSSNNVKVEVLPTLDGRGRLYDVGSAARQNDADDAAGPGNRRKREKHFETHDPKTHELVRYNADDDSTTLTEMLRQEKFGGGMADQKDQDTALAKAIMGDGKFENDLDYIDDNAAKLGRQKLRSDAIKRQFAIHDYKRTQQALANCDFCFSSTSSDELPPRAPIIALGTRVYLSCTTHEELVPGHCLIVPIQHCLSMLEGDDDVWEEVKNFMKTLMQMFAAQDPPKRAVFYETVTPGSMKGQRHSYIECVPVEWETWEELGGYFKESILSSGSEWSTHRKLIDFSSRPGGFRRSMVPNLPYFMVQFDYKGEKGYGHVGYGMGDEEEDVLGMEGTGEKGGGEFSRYFAAEIIGNVLGLEPRRWRRPRKILGGTRDKDRVGGWKGWYDKYDWTGMIGKE
ncbi:CwfJ C-terminus 1-domain-containing protein-like protein [Rhodocollybia butyracea]|uniref:CwfJ C-terminus 1-domain-containing protein-like protein n=1 Tax=Rhodocollybia butyracea TaxID=206335 RepID=A0A9P5U097_9AGAR|nr:CwfJ C-terminus 1-domain-containing protein-like protein [Rhodocollybia butyracea]